MCKYFSHWIGGNRKRFLQSTNADKKIDINSVFDCHLSPVGRQMAIENTVYNNFLSTFPDSIGVLDCRLPHVCLSIYS